MTSYVMITGAAGGLGKALAAEYAERGHPLFLTDVSPGLLETFHKGLERMVGVNVVSYPCDLTDDRASEAMWSWIGRNGYSFDGLLNVAGVNHQGPFTEIGVDRLLDMLKLNIGALVTTTRRILDHRTPDRVLRIVNISSLGCFFPMPHKTVYAASKRFVHDFSVALSEELRGDRVSVMSVCPAGLPTKPANIRSVNDGHGLWGFLTEKNVGWVAHRIYDRSRKGRTVYIPGRTNVFLGWVSRVLPVTTLARYLRRRHARVVERTRN
jgi:short-subunit dehydrogenase